MNVDPLLTAVVGVTILAICLGLLLRQLKQPYVIGYILIGVVIGSFSNDLLGLESMLSQFGNLGIVLLLFFIGMHVSLPKLVSRWRVAVIGTLLQVTVTVFIVWLVVSWLDWPLSRILLLGFVISLSSTAVVLKILHDRNELKTKVGQNVLGILLVQDLAIIPMIITLQVLGGGGYNVRELVPQVIGGLAIILLVVFLLRKGRVRLPFADHIAHDHEIQVFVAILLCFGFSLLTGWLGLSTALGAFLAGIIVSGAESTSWVQHRLDSFHVVFVALFFIYVGMLIDLEFLREYVWIVLAFVLGTFVLNTTINMTILHALGDTWRESLYAAGLLAQIGEFSFLLATIGLGSGIIFEFGYQLAISTIAITLLCSPLWIMLIRRVMHIDADYVFERLPKLRW